MSGRVGVWLPAKVNPSSYAIKAFEFRSRRYRGQESDPISSLCVCINIDNLKVRPFLFTEKELC